MMSKFVSAVLISGLLFGVAAPVEAAPKKAQYQNSESGDGYTLHRRRGGYSYSYSDSVNTYGQHRRRPGPPTFREQTTSGPFDNSFFFDSAMGLHGGNSPYMN